MENQIFADRKSLQAYTQSGYIELVEPYTPFNDEEEDKPLFKRTNCCEKLSYYLSPKKQFDLLYRVIKLDRRSYPPVYASNKVNNKKYSLITFLPMFLYNQFKYFYNLYY